MDVLDFTPEISAIQLTCKANLEVELTDLSDIDLSSVLVAKIRLFITSTQMHKCFPLITSVLSVNNYFFFAVCCLFSMCPVLPGC